MVATRSSEVDGHVGRRIRERPIAPVAGKEEVRRGYSTSRSVSGEVIKRPAQPA